MSTRLITLFKVPILKVKLFFFLFSGYMSLEYAINGVVPVKTDVYGSGVLLLEILKWDEE